MSGRGLRSGISKRLEISSHLTVLIAAERMAERIQEAVKYLLEYPNMGRPGRVSGTRELVASGTPFVVVYRA